MTDPIRAARWLDRKALADYISEREDRLKRIEREGRIPKPSYALGPRSPRWWSPDVDAAMGLSVASPQGGPDLAQAIREETPKGRAHRQEALGQRHGARVPLPRLEGASEAG